MPDRYWNTRHEHQHIWTNVAQGYWSRYPNPNSGHVFTVDTIETKVVDGKLHIKRFILKNNPLPRWGEHFFKTRRVGLVEECVVDPANMAMTAYVRNIGLTKFMATVEKQTFRPNVEDLDKTLVDKEVWIDSSIYGFRSAIRKFGIDRYKKNCILATEGFEFVLNRLFGRRGVPDCDPNLVLTSGAASHASEHCGSNPSGHEPSNSAHPNVVPSEDSANVSGDCSAAKGGKGSQVNTSKTHTGSTGSYAFNFVHAQTSYPDGDKVE